MSEAYQGPSIGYFFVNRNYMKEVQWGIQALHCAVQMSTEYKQYSHEPEEDALLWEKWATYDRTVYLLDGGNVAMLTDLYQKLVPLAVACNVPFGKFHEDHESLGGVITCVGVIVPADIIEYNKAVRGKTQHEIDMIAHELNLPAGRQELADLIRPYRLA